MLPPAGAEADAVRVAIGKIYAGVDAAYAAGDVDAIASFAAPNAQVVIQDSRLPLLKVLASVWEQIDQGARFRSVSAITAIRVTGAEAVVWVNNESTVSMGDRQQSVLSVNRDVWVKTANAWKLKESTLIATNVAK
jgi:hypothetical protein